MLLCSPCVLQGGKVVDRVNGAHVPELTKKTAAHSQTLAVPTSSSQETQPIPTKEVSHTVMLPNVLYHVEVFYRTYRLV